MATFARSRTISTSSSHTYYEKSSCIEEAGHHTKLHNSSFAPNPSISQASRSRNMLFKAAQRLRSLVSAVQNMSCTRICGGHSRGLNSSRPSSGADVREKQVPAREFEAQRHISTLVPAEQPKGLSTAVHEQQWMNLPENNTHTLAPSTNIAYKSSMLFSDETLRFANAFLPSMEALEIWGTPASVESEATPPSNSWVRRHTCIRPGNVIQIPSASDKDTFFLLSSQNESEWKCNVDSRVENGQSEKLFIVQAGGGVERPIGYSRAFLMCKPGSEF